MERLEKFLSLYINEEKLPEVLEKYKAYMDGVLDWNEKVNLTNITNKEEFVEKHYLDSLAAAGLKEMADANKILDLGTGGGFPGVPLAILFQEKEFVLMDSLNKRMKIVQQLCDEIGITNVRTVHGRAEEMGRNKEYREAFDLCVSRAVANLATLSEYCIPFVKKGGYFISYKGPDVEKEISAAKKAMGLLGGKVERIEDVSIDSKGGEVLEHKLVVIKKHSNTPKAYPRQAGKPSSKPLGQ